MKVVSFEGNLGLIVAKVVCERGLSFHTFFKYFFFNFIFFKDYAVAAVGKKRNNVRVLREQQLMSKAELARKAGISALTIDRVEEGKSCRMDTKRKIILALGLKLSDKNKVFVD